MWLHRSCLCSSVREREGSAVSKSDRDHMGNGVDDDRDEEEKEEGRGRIFQRRNPKGGGSCGRGGSLEMTWPWISLCKLSERILICKKGIGLTRRGNIPIDNDCIAVIRQWGKSDSRRTEGFGAHWLAPLLIRMRRREFLKFDEASKFAWPPLLIYKI